MIKVKVLEQKRPDYQNKLWEDYDLLYSGGAKIRAKPSRFLIQNAAEHENWYKERLARFHYKNIVGTIVDDYASTVFQEHLEINAAREGNSRPKVDDFYSEELWKDPGDDGEGDLNELAFRTLTQAMVKHESWTMVTVPDSIPGYEFTNLAEQEAAGGLRVMLRPVCPSHVINAAWDAKGLAWAMLRYRFASNQPLQDLGKDEKPLEKIQWTLLTRQSIRSWELAVERGKEPKDDDEAAEIGKERRHLLADFEEIGAVPIQRFWVKDTLWMLDRVSLMAIEELRKRNALAWYEYLVCFPQLAHKGEEALNAIAEDGEDKNRKRGAQYAWELGPDGELEWLEPAGSSLSHLKEKLEEYERDIYKGVQQMAAAQGPGAAAAMTSAASKVRDNVAKTILCERYAHACRSYWERIATLAAAARGDEIDWEVSGASRFDLQDQEGAVNTALKSQAISWINKSPTLVKELAKRTSRALLPDASTEVLDQVEDELDQMKVLDPDDAMEGQLPGGGGSPPPRKKGNGAARPGQAGQ